jgi:hypothetical protein
MEILHTEYTKRCCSWRRSQEDRRENKRKDRPGLSKGRVSKHVVKDFVKGNLKKKSGGVLKGRLDTAPPPPLSGKALKCILL